MAQGHSVQDTSAQPTAKPAAPAEGPWRGRQLGVMALGLNVWAIATAWPALIGAPGWASSLPPLALLAGVTRLGAQGGGDGGTVQAGARRVPWAAEALLLGVFPLLIGLSIAARPLELNHRSFGPLALSLLVLSLLTFGAFVSAICGTSDRRLPSTHSTLTRPDRGLPAAAERPPVRRWVYVGGITAGAFAIGVIAPLWGGLPALRRHWGDAAVEGGLLTAVVAAALAVALVAALLGEGLRTASTPPRPIDDRASRVAMLLFLSLLGAVTYLVIGRS